MSQCLCTGTIRAGILTLKYMEEGRIVVVATPLPRQETRPCPLPERTGPLCQKPC